MVFQFIYMVIIFYECYVTLYVERTVCDKDDGGSCRGQLNTWLKTIARIPLSDNLIYTLVHLSP